MSSVNEKLTAIASEVRTLSGASGTLGLDLMATNLIEANNEVIRQSELLEQLVSALEDKASASEPSLQSKTVSPSTSKQTVTPDNGYDGLSSVVVNAIPSNYIVPSGTKTITTNGTHDVKAYASATVNIAGEDVTSETNAYTTKLATLETAITALETELQGKANGGSGGGGVETCNVAIFSAGGGGSYIWFTSVDANGSITTKNVVMEGGFVMSSGDCSDVVCGSLIVVDGIDLSACVIEGTAELMLTYENCSIFKAPTVAGEDCQISKV